MEEIAKQNKIIKNEKVAQEAIAEYVTDILSMATFDLFCTDARQHGICLFYISKKQTKTNQNARIILSYYIIRNASLREILDVSNDPRP